MRLICPNCDAEYEVDNAAIPDTGRDVQCSSCGHAWFQLPPEVELALEQEDELFGSPVGDATASGPSAATGAAPAEDDAEGPAPAMPAQKRTVDENLMAILREEAEREAEARKAEAAPIETQTEMGLAAPPVRAGGLVGAARRIAQLKGIDPDAAPKPAPRPGSRRDMLPDIEEINSSLKGGDAALGLPELEPAIATPSGNGFRSGFALSLLIAAAGVAAYVMEPRISEQIPAAAGAMQAYVGVVDDARLWLDGIMRAATASLRDISATDAGSGG